MTKHLVGVIPENEGESVKDGKLSMSNRHLSVIAGAVFLACTVLGALVGSKLRDVLRDSLTEESMEIG